MEREEGWEAPGDRWWWGQVGWGGRWEGDGQWWRGDGQMGRRWGRRRQYLVVRWHGEGPEGNMWLDAEELEECKALDVWVVWGGEQEILQSLVLCMVVLQWVQYFAFPLLLVVARLFCCSLFPVVPSFFFMQTWFTVSEEFPSQSLLCRLSSFDILINSCDLTAFLGLLSLIPFQRLTNSSTKLSQDWGSDKDMMTLNIGSEIRKSLLSICMMCFQYPSSLFKCLFIHICVFLSNGMQQVSNHC